MREPVFNDVDEHYPCCNEQCHGSIHYLGPDERMGETAEATVTLNGTDMYINGKFVQRLYEDDG